VMESRIDRIWLDMDVDVDVFVDVVMGMLEVVVVMVWFGVGSRTDGTKEGKFSTVSVCLNLSSLRSFVVIVAVVVVGVFLLSVLPVLVPVRDN
jgi:hypothetical protein